MIYQICYNIYKMLTSLLKFLTSDSRNIIISIALILITMLSIQRNYLLKEIKRYKDELTAEKNNQIILDNYGLLIKEKLDEDIQLSSNDIFIITNYIIK